MDASDIARKWLHQFADALATQSVNGVTALILPHGWLRDILVWTWDIRALSGHEKIAAYLSANPGLGSFPVSNVVLEEAGYLKPATAPFGPFTAVDLAFRFETPHTRGRGAAKLLEDQDGEWRAVSVMVSLDDFKDHEEQTHPIGLEVGKVVSYGAAREEQVAAIERDPYIVIIGAAQTGLQVAARFKQMNIPTLVLEQASRIGNSWRERYPTLTLHTPRSHHTLLYQPFPSNWPKYTAKDRFATWLEAYASTQEILVWTNSSVINTPKPVYDPVSRRWTLTVNRGGTLHVLRPAHVIFATGTLGRPSTPALSLSGFKGEAWHTQGFPGGAHFAGKRVVVVGTGNSAQDAVLDLHHAGAASVTLLQRTSTCVATLAFVDEWARTYFPEDVPTEVNDFRMAAVPFGQVRQLIASGPPRYAISDEMRKRLEACGFKLNDGDGLGIVGLINRKFGGYWTDIGGMDLIVSGKIAVRSGVEIARVEQQSVILTDGTSVAADALIFATGYGDPREQLADVFGADVIGSTKGFWGMEDEEGEQPSYRPSGHPGIWYAGGDFHISRAGSKWLALQIKARQLGVVSE